MINIYCDESCHLQHDDSDIMLLGAVSCNKAKVRTLSKALRKLKKDFGLSETFETKWTKVSPAKLDFYLALLDFFFNTPELSFRCIIATGKKDLDNESFHQTYDEWYYKMYYLLLCNMIEPVEQYNVYIDIKDTQGGSKVRKLKDILNNFLYRFHTTCLRNVQIIKSDESELLQLCDLIMGCVGYHKRFLRPYGAFPESTAKVKMCEKLESLAKRPLDYSTPKNESKFNIFVWGPRV